MSYETRKKSDRERQERKRLRDEHDRLAGTRVIDQVLVAAMRSVLRDRHGGLVGKAWRDKSELGTVVATALHELERMGFDITNPVQTARVLHRLGDTSRDHVLARCPGDLF